MAEHSSC